MSFAEGDMLSAEQFVERFNSLSEAERFGVLSSSTKNSISFYTENLTNYNPKNIYIKYYTRKRQNTGRNPFVHGYGLTGLDQYNPRHIGHNRRDRIHSFFISRSGDNPGFSGLIGNQSSYAACWEKAKEILGKSSDGYWNYNIYNQTYWTEEYEDGNVIGSFGGTGDKGWELNIEKAVIQESTIHFEAVGGNKLTARSVWDMSFNDFVVNEVFCLHTELDDKSVSINAEGSSLSETIYSTGKWRIYTAGSWQGSVSVEYSKNNGLTWQQCYNFISNAKSNSNNANSSGEIESINGVVLLRIRTTGIAHDQSHPFEANLSTENGELNSYYKILEKKSDTEMVVECVKNNIGTTSSYKWREAIFSNRKKWPKAIGFYQNRLFFGKGYELYGSKIDDFWDFYEPTSVNKDDYINMSLLSYQVNEINDIVTLRTFFAFTEGAEYAIASEGALSQDDKFLKQLSSHGTNASRPIIAGNVVLFSDASQKRIRVLKYAFETESYEAEEVSTNIEEILEQENITSAEWNPEKKEAYFLSDTGVLFVLKFFPEQNILAWSHWKHAKGDIKNICVIPNGSYYELYVSVLINGELFLEKLSSETYMDSSKFYSFKEKTNSIVTDFAEGESVFVKEVEYLEGNKESNRHYKVIVKKDGVVDFLGEVQNAWVGRAYTSEACLLSPVSVFRDGAATTFNRMKVFKVHFVYNNSYGFSVGAESEDCFEPNLHNASIDMEEEQKLTSGKNSVLISSKYDGSGRVRFFQDKPFPMNIENVLLEVDYGGR